jgi:hypothetical protein
VINPALQLKIIGYGQYGEICKLHIDSKNKMVVKRIRFLSGKNIEY